MPGTVGNDRGAIRRRLAALLRRGDAFDIIEGALLVAAEEYPRLDLEREQIRLDAMAKEGRRRASGRSNLFARLDAVQTYLFDDLGFHGNEEEYDDPRNSFLNEVLDRRSGIPLTLSIIFMKVAQGAGFKARGVGLPGHFVVRLDRERRSLLVDPFHRARVITVEDCRDLVARSTGRPGRFRPELLDGVGSTAMLVRLLRNLKSIYLAKRDYERCLSVVDRLLLAAPDEPAELRDRGFVLAHLGQPSAALSDLEAYLELAPDAPDADAVRDRLAWLQRRVSKLN